MIGETFCFDVLHAIFPINLQEDVLKAHLSSLVFKNFLTEEANKSSSSQCFKFTHSMVRLRTRMRVCLCVRAL